ncbi:hypothetical protein MNBD_BACTEROID05-1146 [hydrothermal vent metagenome]|uniref:Prepilin-type N-terminal cleavage/methylation domain-containing protein n=1 Tax=hydrothermal vent metagenome TaxID=652676 RepID=A0A3B0TEG3_9ZZZZ
MVMFLKKNRNRNCFFLPDPLVQKQAFTLPELMIAVMILAIVLTGALGTFIYCSILSNSTKNRTFAISEAQSKIDEISDSTYDSIVSTYNSTTFNLTQISNGTASISVSQIGADVAADLLQVDITVSWKNKDNRDISSSLTAYVARK